MQCAQCGENNPEQARFCIECGAPFAATCPQCAAENPGRAKFCASCGTPLTGEHAKLQPPAPIPQPLAAERRQLTVMFCDVVGSTALSSQLDPEDLREVIRTYHQTCAKIIAEYNGYIAQYLGDGLLVYFGYPIAHEDDARLAVRSGVRIIEALGEQQIPTGEPERQQSLQVRIGIHTGLVVVGEIGDGSKQEQLALGETPNLAARIQGLATPDTIVLSAATYRLIEGFFTCHTLGTHEIKGIVTPIELYRVESEQRTATRLEVAAARGFTPLIGRDEEVELLLKRWKQANAGEGQVVVLQGEAGIGKSRLLRVFGEHARDELEMHVECRCSPFSQNSAFYPVIELLQRLLHFTREDTSEAKIHKLETMLARNGMATPELLPLFASMLSLPVPVQYPALSLTPQKLKEKTQHAVLSWILTQAQHHPVCFAVEDIHWADPSTLEFLAMLLDRVSTAPVLVVLTARPEFVPPWAMAAHITHLALRRLSRSQIATMIEGLAGRQLAPEVIQQLVTKTDGVPLFIEELTKATLEVDESINKTTARIPQIPATLHDSLMARLDRLHTAKEIAQVGAVIGREFSYELLRAIAPFDDARLQEALAKLVESELLYQRGLPPQSRYLFKHALIQDAAYQSLLKNKRQQYHCQIAQVLERQFPDTQETQPELLAHHYTDAGLMEQAIPYWQQAGQRAMQRSANAEAIRQFSTALELLHGLPETPQRTATELSLLLLRAAPLIATQGYAFPEVRKSYERARELCDHVTDPYQLFRALWGLALFYTNAGENRLSLQLTNKCMELAEQRQDPSLLLQAHFFKGALLHWFGELSGAETHLQRATALYDFERDHSLVFVCGLDLGMGSTAYHALNLWCLGYPDQATKQTYAALHHAERASHPHSQCFAKGYVALIHFLRGEAEAACQHAVELTRLAEEYLFPHYGLIATIWRGVALVAQGNIAEGAQLALTAGAARLKTGTGSGGQTLMCSFLAEVSRKAGHVEEGLDFVTRGLRVVSSGEEMESEAELYRLKGELTLQKGARDWGLETSFPSPQASSLQPQVPMEVAEEAEGHFLKALNISRAQQAKSLELRATMSLARLWQWQGKQAEAHRMLSEVYNWFTEGFETKELQEAKALLIELEERH